MLSHEHSASPESGITRESQYSEFCLTTAEQQSNELGHRAHLVSVPIQTLMFLLTAKCLKRQIGIRSIVLALLIEEIHPPFDSKVVRMSI